MACLQLVALQRTVLVQSLRHQELRSTNPRPQEAWSAIRHNQIEKTYLITPRYQTSKGDLRMAQDSEIHLWDPRSGTSLKWRVSENSSRIWARGAACPASCPNANPTNFPKHAQLLSRHEILKLELFPKKGTLIGILSLPSSI